MQLDPAARVVTAPTRARQATGRATGQARRSSAGERFEALVRASPLPILTLDPAGNVTGWSPAAERVFGWSEAEMLGRPYPLVPDEDRDEFQLLRERVLRGEALSGLEVRRRRKDGSLLDVGLSTAPLHDATGAVTGTLAMLEEIGERKRGEEAQRDSERRIRAMAESAIDAIVSADGSGRITFVNAATGALFGYTQRQLLGRRLTRLMPPRYRAAHQRGLSRFLSTGESRVIGNVVELQGLRRDGSEVPIELSLASWQTGSVVSFTAVLRDISARRRIEAEHTRLLAAIEQTADSIVISDPDGAIVYANAAFEAASGYDRDAVLGGSTQLLGGDAWSGARYDAIGEAMLRGETWAGDLTIRREDGTSHTAATTITPIRDTSDRLAGYVAVGRDVTRERALESALERQVRERAELAARLSRLRAGETLEATASAICAEMVRLAGIDFAGVIHFAVGHLLVPLAVHAPAGAPITVGRPIPRERAAYLHERALIGPWAEPWRIRPEDGTYGEQLAAAGLRAVAYAPIHGPTRLVGLVILGTSSPELAERFNESIPVALEFAAVAGALLGPAHEQRYEEATARAGIVRVVRETAFDTVFQPIVELATGAVVGHEALTRFRDGTPPSERFANAAALGLGPALEAACLRKALATAAGLPAAEWLSVNVSPAFLLQGGVLAAEIAAAGRPLVLEVTEHAVIEDYAALRRALDTLRPAVRLAVDDAGAGFSSFRHILETRPDFVKLDIALVRGIERDPARQALIAGMEYFAVKTKCTLIAEGVETEAEAASLRSLGVWLGQGYLFGRPAPASEPEDPRPGVRIG